MKRTSHKSSGNLGADHNSKTNSEQQHLLKNRLKPTTEQIHHWLDSSEVRKWIEQLPMGVEEKLINEAISTLKQGLSLNSNKDITAKIYNIAALGVDVLRWQLWAAYEQGRNLVTPDCPYTLKQFLENSTSTNQNNK